MENTEKKVIKFLDYNIIPAGEEFLLHKLNGEPYEMHLGIYNSLETAKMSSIIWYMIARPKKFAETIFFRSTGMGGQKNDYNLFKESLKDEGITMPEEITEVGGIDSQTGYKGMQIQFKGIQSNFIVTMGPK